MEAKRKTLHINFFSIIGAILFALLALGNGYFLLSRVYTVGVTIYNYFLWGYGMDAAILLNLILTGVMIVFYLFAMIVMGLMALAMLLGRKNKFLCLCTALLIVEKLVGLLITPLHWLLAMIFNAVTTAGPLVVWIFSFIGLIAPVILTLFVCLTCFSRKERCMTWAKCLFFLPALAYIVLGLLGIPVIVSGIQSVSNMVQLNGDFLTVFGAVLSNLVSVSNFYVMFLAYLALGAWVAFPKKRKPIAISEPQ